MKMKPILSLGATLLAFSGFAHAQYLSQEAIVPQYAQNATPELVNHYCYLMGKVRAVKIADAARDHCASQSSSAKVNECVDQFKKEAIESQKTSLNLLEGMINPQDVGSFLKPCDQHFIQGLDVSKSSLKKQVLDTLTSMKVSQERIQHIKNSLFER